VALPIFEPIIEAIWAKIAPKTALREPSAEAESHLVDLPIDYESGDRVKSRHGFIEHFRREPDGKLDDTQYQLVSHRSSPNSGVRSVRAEHPQMAWRKSSPTSPAQGANTSSGVRSVRAEHPQMAWRKSSPTSPAQGANTSNQGYYWGGNQGYGGLYLNWGGWGGASWR
jgi:hypothetical protein